MTACPLPSTVAFLSYAERQAIALWIDTLLREGRHLEASTLRSKYFPLI